ncbi:MAG: branched-chain amino acid ABC transporter permease [Deltaproteobacteria bacterium]|nr:branched-chain amino acid ABC transporter permease [Deltaproteobacteria bacterium]
MLVQIIFTGLYMGCIYGLVGLGFVIIFNASKVFNFAQGEFLMLGAMFYVTFSLSLKLPFILSLLCCIASMAIVGFIIEAMGEVVWGKYPIRAPEIFQTVDVTIANHPLRVQGLVIIVGTLMTLLILWFFFKKTMFGKAFRAAALNTEM